MQQSHRTEARLNEAVCWWHSEDQYFLHDGGNLLAIEGLSQPRAIAKPGFELPMDFSYPVKNANGMD